MKNDHDFFDGNPADPDNDFQSLWRMQKKGVNEDIFSDDHIRSDFNYTSGINWNKLRSIAHKQTAVERLWQMVGGLTGKQVAYIGIGNIIATPFMLILVYTWAMNKINTGAIMQEVIGWTVMASCIGLAAMIVGTPLYFLYKRLNSASNSEKRSKAI